MLSATPTVHAASHPSDAAPSSTLHWYGLTSADGWNLERPPDQDADFHGDDKQWNVARAIWYKTATGKELPPEAEITERKTA